MANSNTRVKTKAKVKTDDKTEVNNAEVKIKAKASSKVKTEAQARPGTFGFLLDRLERVYPAPPELGPAKRPYSWEREASAVQLVKHVEHRRLRSTKDTYVLSYWENQSGGEGWGWKLKFGDAREVVDFVCVVGLGLSCEDEPPLPHGEDDEIDEQVLALAAIRPQVLGLVAQGLPDPWAPLIVAFGGGIESISAASSTNRRSPPDSARNSSDAC